LRSPLPRLRAVLLTLVTALAITLVPSAAAQAAPCPALSDVSHPLAPAYAPDVYPEVKQYCASPGYDLTVGDQERILAEHVRATFVDEVESQVACAPENDCDFSDDVDWVGTQTNDPFGPTRIFFYTDPAAFPGPQNFYCAYDGTVSGLTGDGNSTIEDESSSCVFYIPAPTQAWTWASTKKPATARAQKWETCAPSECEDFPVRHVGTAEKFAAEEIAVPHWIANVAPWDASTYYAGSVKSTGSPGNWTVFVNVYRDRYNCEYKVTVTGNEADPTVTRVGSPVCATAVDEFCTRYLTSEGQVQGMEGPIVGPAPGSDWLSQDGFTFALLDANPCAHEPGGAPITRSTAEYINTVENGADFWNRANAAGARKTSGGFHFTGTTASYKDSSDVWQLTTVSYIRPPNGNYADLGYYCVYTGTFEGAYDTGTYTSGGTPSCGYYASTIPGWGFWQDSQPPSGSTLPPDTEWRGSYPVRNWPLEHIWSKGEAEELALVNVAWPSWNSAWGPTYGNYAAYNTSDTLYSIGSTKTSGRVNDWDVYVNIFKDTGAGTIWNCEYHARVYVDPVTDTRQTTSLSAPVCGSY